MTHSSRRTLLSTVLCARAMPTAALADSMDRGLIQKLRAKGQ